VKIKPPETCQYDVVALGEVMLRLDPGDGRISTARAFQVWEGGGEYNVARGLRRCFGHRAALVTALADNDVGRLIEDFILQGGVDTAWINWIPYDGVGRATRNGLNFTERGFGARGAKGTPLPPNCALETSTGTGSSASPGCAGSTPAASSLAYPTQQPTSFSRLQPPLVVTGRSSRTTSTTVPASGDRSEASTGHRL
jgi:hypothetical protein